MASNTNFSLCSPRASSGQDPHKPIIVSSHIPDTLPENHILLKIDRFGFSANNITYQALGDHPHFRYFEFYSVPEADVVNPKTHGLIPVWGFATVVASSHPKIQVGERVYGYLAPTRYLVIPVSPNDVNKHAFYVPRPHLPPDRRPYNQILRCSSDPHYIPTPEAEDLTMLYRPLFWTSYWCEDWLNSTNYRGGASSILISSASAKTAFCLAYLVKKRILGRELPLSTRIIGLTSDKNVDFSKKLELYHEVVTYDDFEHMESFKGGMETRWLYVDVAGNKQLNERVSKHFASPYTGRLIACISLGVTSLSPASNETGHIDWQRNTFDSTQSGSSDFSTSSTVAFWPKFEHFFMPEWLDVRKRQLPILEISERQNKAWKELMRDCRGWVKLERVHGAKAVKGAYERLVKMGLGPDKGYIWSLWDEDRFTSRL